MISVRNLNVYYGKRHTLKNISIDVPERCITAIIGPSGCGKTTLFRCFNRLTDSNPDIRVTGQVLVAGEDIFAPGAEVTHLRRRMGLLSQRPYPLPMSIYENVAFGMKLHFQLTKAEMQARVEAHLRQAGLWEEVKDRLKSPAASLSIGQQQRLCLARGLAVEPEVILGDEPTSALDPVSSGRIEEAFLELKKERTVVVVTHILRQARRIADYVVYMYGGEIIEHGPAHEVLDNPKEKLTRDYVLGVVS